MSSETIILVKFTIEIKLKHEAELQSVKTNANYEKSITTLFFLLLMTLSGFSQTTFCLKLTEVSNDGDNYVVKIEMQGSELFQLGSANLQFGFPETALGEPEFLSTTLPIQPAYFLPTVTVPLTGQASFNIELGFAGTGSDIVAAPSWSEIGQVSFPIINASNLEPLEWSYNGGTTQTVAFLDDEATQMFATTPSCLVFEGGDEEVPLVRFTMVDPLTRTVTLKNFGLSETDITDYRFCSNFNYSDGLNDENTSVISGDLVLSPNEEVTIMWESPIGFGMAGDDMGLYLPSGGFGDPLNMMDFMQYLTTGNPREGVADEKGIWVAGTTVMGAFPYTFNGEADDFGVDFWSANTAIAGCTESAACNYNENATEDDGSCVNATGCDVCSGETDGTGVVVDNSEIGDECDDGDPTTSGDMITDCNGTCIGTPDPILGCTDETACNYNEMADTDDGTCMYALGCDICLDGVVIDNPEIGDVCDDNDPDTSNDIFVACGDCQGVANPILGCTDTAACNYNELADTDDGTCVFATGCDICFEGTVVDFPEIGDECDDGDPATSNDVILNCDGDCMGSIEPVVGCIDNAACNFDPLATIADESCVYATGCDECDGNGGITDNPEIGESCLLSDVPEDFGVVDENCICVQINVPGCTDELACNYNASATEDDGTCIVPTGCDFCFEGELVDVPEIGDECDDNDDTTENDVYVSCDLCQGTPFDCEAEAGSISTTSETTICAGDGIDDIVNVDLVPGVGASSTLVITNETGVILGIPPGLMANFEGAGVGVCSMYHLTYYGDITGLLEDSNLADFEGCFALSEPIIITRLSGDDCPTEFDCPELMANIGDECDDGNDDLFPGTVNELCECEPGVPVYDCPALEADFGDSCDDGDPNTINDVVNTACVCIGMTESDCTPVVLSVWGIGPWYPVTHGTFVAQSSNDAIIAMGTGDLSIEVFVGTCDGTSLGMYNTVGDGEIERIIVGGLVVGQTYSYSISGGTDIMSKVKTYANGRLRDDECPGSFNILNQIHALRDYQMYDNPEVQVTGFTYRFEDIATGDVFVEVRNAVDGHSPQLSTILGLQVGHTYNVQVKHRVLQIANGSAAHLYSEYGTQCTISIVSGPVSDCIVVPPTIWGTGPWTNATQGTFVAKSSNDAILAKGDGDLFIEVFLGECGGTSIGIFSTVPAGSGNDFIERIVVGDLNAGQTYSYFVTDGTNVMSKVKTYADGRLRDNECSGTFNLSDQIHALRENELYSNPAVQVTGFSYRFEDVVTGEVYVEVRNTVDGHTPQLSTIIGLQSGHSYHVQVAHRVLQVANGIVSELYSDFGSVCTISINGGADTIMGCTDASACNYDANADSDDGSCVSPEGCDSCSGQTDGTGTVIDNPEIGDACDDGNSETESDMYVECGVCEGILTPSVDSSTDGTAVSQFEETVKADVFPNPNTGESVNVILSNLNDADQMVTIEVMDVYGKKVFSEAYAINGSTMRQELVFDNDLTAGLYLVQISVNGESVTQKLSIK